MSQLISLPQPKDKDFLNAGAALLASTRKKACVISPLRLARWLKFGAVTGLLGGSLSAWTRRPARWLASELLRGTHVVNN